MLVIRQIWFIGLVSLVSLTCLVSCGGGSGDDPLLASQPEIKGPGGEIMTPITFRGNESEETSVTRAGTPTPLSDMVKNFNVWGYKDKSIEGLQQVFPGYVVKWQLGSVATTSTNTNGWDYVLSAYPEQYVKYWDWDVSSYRFFALAVVDPTDHNVTDNGITANKQSFTMPVDVSSDAEMANNPYFSHLWYSTGNPTDYPDKQFGQPVTLEFQKTYSRVRFIYKYVYPREGIKLEEQEFKPTDDSKIARKSTLTITYPVTGVDIKESFTATPVVGGELSAFTVDYDPDDDTKDYTGTDEGWYIVAPNTAQGSYKLTVKVNKVEKTAVVPATYMQWLPGYSYTYIFKITDEGGIEIGWVDYAVTPWVEQEIDYEVYNW